MLTFIVIFIVLIQLWFIVAFAYAFAQTREPLLWLQIVQSVILIGVFYYISRQIALQAPLNAGIVLILLGICVALMVVWRRRVTQTDLGRSYPRGMRDIFGFRRPAVDLKRRVRSK